VTKLEKLELDVRGMTCASCGQHVSRALQSVPGVVEAEVPGWQSSRATVVAAPEVSEAALAEAVAAAGYQARVVARRSRRISLLVTAPAPPTSTCW